MIDYLAQKRLATQNVNDLLASRPQDINSRLAQNQSDIEASRNQNLGDALSNNLSGIASQYNLGPITPNTNLIRRNLASNLNMNMAQQKSGLNQQNFGDMLNQKGNQVSDAQNILGMNKQYAQANTNQNIAQQQAAKMNDMQRQEALKQAQMGLNYAEQGASLQNQYQFPQTDYQSSIMRVLTGLPVQIGTSIAMNKYFPMNKTVNPTVNLPVAGVNGYGIQQPYGGMTRNTSSGTAGIGGY